MKWLRTIAIALTTAMLFTSTGCSLLHNLKPHRLWRLNRATNGMHTDAYYSVSDPIPPREARSSEAGVPESVSTPERREPASAAPDASVYENRVALHEKLKDKPFMQSQMMLDSLD